MNNINVFQKLTRAWARVSFCICFLFIFILQPVISQARQGEPDESVKDKAVEEQENRKDNTSDNIGGGDSGKGSGRRRGGRHNVFTIGEIVVKGESIAHIDQAATTTEITERDLKARGNRTLDEAMSTVPGVQVEAHQKGHMRVKIRGFDQDKIAILVDGMPVADVFSTDIDLSDISVKNISRIYVNRGVSSALYGASGAVGAINIVSKKPQKLFARGGVEYGMYNNYTIDAAVGGPFKNFYGWITASVQNSDGWRPSRHLDIGKRLAWTNRLIRYYVYGVSPADINVPGPWQYIFETGKWNHTDFRKYSTLTRFGYEYKDILDVGVSARFTYGSNRTNTYQNRCYSDYKINNLAWGDPVFHFTSGEDIKKAGLANRSFSWPEKYYITVSPYAKINYKFFSIKVQGFYSQNYAKQEGFLDNACLFPKDPAAVIPGAVNYEPFYDYKTYESYGIQVYPSFRIASWNRLNFAILWRGDEMEGRQQAKSILLSPRIFMEQGMSKYKVNYLKAYFLTVAVEDEISIKDKLKITAGVSYDAQDFLTHKTRHEENSYIYGNAYIVKGKSMIWGTRDSFNPVAGLVINAVEDLLTMKSAFSMKTRFPTLGEYEKVSSPLYDRGLKPERSYNVNAGFQFFFLEKDLEFGSDYFYNIVRNRIEKIAGGEEPPVNIDRVDSQGFETTVAYRKKNIAKVMEIRASASYTFLHARNLDTSWEEAVNKGKYLENTPAHQIIADVRFTFVSGTSFGIWGTALIDQIMYVQRIAPPVGTFFYSRQFFDTVKLHNQFNLNVKVSQEIWKHFTLYVLFKNILDDYNPDPFNPGPGFMCYGGFEAKL